MTFLMYLKDFYFEASYPGDNFTGVIREERDKCLAIVRDVIQKVEHLCDDVSVSVKQLGSF